MLFDIKQVHSQINASTFSPGNDAQTPFTSPSVLASSIEPSRSAIALLLTRERWSLLVKIGCPVVLAEFWWKGEVSSAEPTRLGPRNFPLFVPTELVPHCSRLEAESKLGPLFLCYNVTGVSPRTPLIDTVFIHSPLELK